MTAFTLSRNMGSADFLFAGLDDNTFADWNVSRGMEGMHVWKDRSSKKGIGKRIRAFLYR